MRRTALALASLLALSGPALAGKKDKKKKGDDDDAAETSEAAAVPTELPDGADSAKFADKLMGLAIADFKPVDNVGATFVYSTMSFDAGNTWKARGYVEIADERMECSESGTWSMEPADSATVATVSWKVEKTDCAGREAGSNTRAQLTLGKDGIDEALFR